MLWFPFVMSESGARHVWLRRQSDVPDELFPVTCMSALTVVTAARGTVACCLSPSLTPRPSPLTAFVDGTGGYYLLRLSLGRGDTHLPSLILEVMARVKSLFVLFIYLFGARALSCLLLASCAACQPVCVFASVYPRAAWLICLFVCRFV